MMLLGSSTYSIRLNGNILLEPRHVLSDSGDPRMSALFDKYAVIDSSIDVTQRLSILPIPQVVSDRGQPKCEFLSCHKLPYAKLL